MIQKTITLYTVEELKEANPEGYAKAHAKYKEGNDYMFMEDCLRELETYGYDFMEHEDSEENFIEMCEANEYTFTIDGRMENA